MAGDSSRALIVLGVLLAVGMSAGACLLGYQAKQIGGGRQSISVKGLAEKPVKADVAEWTVGVHVLGATFAEALQKSRAALPDLKRFLVSQGFDPSVMRDSAESVTDYSVEKQMPDGRLRTVPQGYQAAQDVVLTSPRPGEDRDRLPRHRAVSGGRASRCVLRAALSGVESRRGEDVADWRGHR